MGGHVKVLGVLYIVTSMLSALGMIGMFAAIAHMYASGEHEAIVNDMPGLVPYMMASVLAYMVLSAVLKLIGGVGLLMRRRWARVLIIVLAILGLIKIPFGTVLGIYALYVLLHRDTEVLFSPYKYILTGDPA